jgi:hypothetical protein
MAKGYGQSAYGASAGGAVLSADGAPEYVTGGVTLDWDTVPAAASGGVTLADGQKIAEGTKYIPFGTIIAPVTADGTYGPHQLGATADGREALAKGMAFLMNRTILEDDQESQYGPGAFDGGKIYKARLKRLNDAGTAYVAHTVDAAFNTAFPRVRFAEH